MAQATDAFRAGQRVKVTQQVPQRDEVWTTVLEGRVLLFEQRKTGSWFAHAKDDKLWLDRLTIAKDDGELVVINLDQYTHVDVLADAPEAVGGAAGAVDHPGHHWTGADRLRAPGVALNSPDNRPQSPGTR